jgi:hypothetical protein
MTEYIDGEQAYPIYNIAVMWQQDGVHDPNYPRWNEGLEEGRIWNCTGFYRMYKTDPGEDNVLIEWQEWWDRYVKEKLEGKNPSRPAIKITRKFYETWCLTWFQHHTFDDGRSDDEFLRSFERYVQRHEQNQDYNNPDYICLMGAEDRWRWKGDSTIEGSKPPCRCSYCQEQGVVRIGH